MAKDDSAAVDATPEAAAPAPVAEAAPVVAPVAPEDPTAFHVTLGEYCTRKSATGISVELLHGFHSDEIASGSVKASEADFDARFAAFADRPV